MSKIVISGDRIRELREHCGFSCENVAKFLGVDVGFLKDVEENKKSLSAHMLERLASLFGVRVQAFFDGSKEKPLIEPFFSVPPAVEKLLEEADQAAMGKGEFYTYEDVFGEE